MYGQSCLFTNAQVSLNSLTVTFVLKHFFVKEFSFLISGPSIKLLEVLHVVV